MHPFDDKLIQNHHQFHPPPPPPQPPPHHNDLYVPRKCGNQKRIIINSLTCLLVLVQLSTMCHLISASPPPSQQQPQQPPSYSPHGYKLNVNLPSSSSSSSLVSPSSSVLLPSPAALSSSSLSSASSSSSSSSMLMTNFAILDYYVTPNVTINFTHIAYDNRSDRLYVGASNWLYQFNSSLEVEVAIETGPVDDSPNCSPNDCSGTDTTMLTTNFNKILVIDENSSKLIACGSVHQGACRRHDLDNIASREELIPIPVAANDENSSTYAFIGPARYMLHNKPVKSVLYIGTTNSRLGTYRDIVPAIASRSLESGPKLFSVIESSFSDSTLVDIESHLKDYYLVKYVYGFHSDDFIYFATVQMKSHLRALQEWGYVTRLARVCSSDAAYNTYTEVTLTCLGPDGTDYTLLQDAVTIKAGKTLAADLNVKPGSPLLIGVFSTSKDHTWDPSDSSAVCVYSIADIETKFNENIHLCYNGSALTRNMDYIAGNIKDCPSGKGNVASFCSETLKLNGSIPIVATSAITYNETLSAITALTVDQTNVAFIGTSQGRLKKILLSHANQGEEFGEITIDPGHPILSDMHIHSNQRYLYVASPYRLAKVEIESYPGLSESNFVKDQNSQRLSSSEPPPSPLNFKVSVLSSKSVNFTWSPIHPSLLLSSSSSSSSSYSSSNHGYIIRYWKVSGLTGNDITKQVNISSLTTTNYLISNLDAGSNYEAEIVAFNGIGLGSPSRIVKFLTLEDAPTGPPLSVQTFARGPHTIRVTWKPPSHDKWNGKITGYHVCYRVISSSSSSLSLSPNCQTAFVSSYSNSHEYMLTSLSRDTTYLITVRASNAAGTGPESPEISVKTLLGDLPSIPRVNIKSTSSNSLTIVYTINSSNAPISMFQLNYKESKDISWKQITLPHQHESLSTHSEYILTNLNPMTIYKLYMTASNSFGISDPSPIIISKTTRSVRDTLGGGGSESLLPDNQIGRESGTNNRGTGGNNNSGGSPVMSEIANAVTIIIGLGAIVIVLLIVFVYSRKIRSKGPAKTSFEFCQTYQTGNLAYNPASTNGSHHQLTHPLHSTGHHVHPHHTHHPLHQTFGSSSPDYGDPESDRTLSLINTPMMDTVDRTMSLMHGSLGVTTINQLTSPYSKILIDTSTDKRNSTYLCSRHIYDYPQ
ncbi:uncharacterized protein LOC128389869 [Panonychus citri]|uniref:uncharacterized protein LOC128389869 n=1 Tax=Panonychus citri TaxID=50023 RepID=UPI002307AAC6|nr:uncharacterized protein LOC128389869 [Panonychus citri]